MINTANTPLYQRPEALYGVCVDISAHIDVFRMVDNLMPVSIPFERVISPSSLFLPPLLRKERGIKGVRLVNSIK